MRRARGKCTNRVGDTGVVRPGLLSVGRKLFGAGCVLASVVAGATLAPAGTAVPRGFEAPTASAAQAGSYMAIINWGLDVSAGPLVPSGTPGAWWWASPGGGRIPVRHFIGPASMPMTLTTRSNAFNSSVRLTIEGSLGGHTSLRIYDQRGRFVRRIAAGAGSVLPQTLLWDGRDQGGARLESGTYYVVLGVGDQWLAQTISMSR